VSVNGGSKISVRVADVAMVVIAVFVVLAYFNGWG
jgi:hypothetical protein